MAHGFSVSRTRLQSWVSCSQRNLGAPTRRLRRCWSRVTVVSDLRDRLLWSIRWLAADPEKALSAAPGTVVADEIALDFNHWLSVGVGHGLVDEAALKILTVIDAEFDAISGERNADQWTPEAVATSAVWKAQRDRARQVLALMGEARADDDLPGHI